MHPGEIDVFSWSWGESNGSAQTRRGTFGVGLTTLYEQELVRYHIEGHYGAVAEALVDGQAVNACLMLAAQAAGTVTHLRYQPKPSKS